MYPHNLCPGKKKKQASALSVIIAHSWALKSYRQLLELARSQHFALHFAIALHIALALLCICCHDPFTVRSTQTCPPFTGFTQLAHPSRCSRSTLTPVCFCVLDLPPRVSVFFTRSITGSSASILLWAPWSVEYQSWKLARLL